MHVEVALTGYIVHSHGYLAEPALELLVLSHVLMSQLLVLVGLLVDSNHGTVQLRRLVLHLELMGQVLRLVAIGSVVVLPAHGLVLLDPHNLSGQGLFKEFLLLGKEFLIHFLLLLEYQFEATVNLAVGLRLHGNHGRSCSSLEYVLRRNLADPHHELLFLSLKLPQLVLEVFLRLGDEFFEQLGSIHFVLEYVLIVVEGRGLV